MSERLTTDGVERRLNIKRLSPGATLFAGLTMAGLSAISAAAYADRHEFFDGETNKISLPAVEKIIVQQEDQLQILPIEVFPEIAPNTIPTPEVNLQTTVYWIFAHPDDETLAAAGAIKKSQGDGNKNVVIIVSSGENTAVGTRLRLTKAQTAAAREKEARAALAVIGVDDIRILGVPDGQVMVDFVKGVIDGLIVETKGEILFRGHSPYDSYLGLQCGHPDHCAAGTALLQSWQEGKIRDLKMYREGQFFDAPRKGTCDPLTSDQLVAKQRMKTEYSRINTAQGRYGIAGQSVPGAWSRATIQPECFDLPTP